MRYSLLRQRMLMIQSTIKIVHIAYVIAHAQQLIKGKILNLPDQSYDIQDLAIHNDDH
jgi:hypothetical protein